MKINTSTDVGLDIECDGTYALIRYALSAVRECVNALANADGSHAMDLSANPCPYGDDYEYEH